MANAKDLGVLIENMLQLTSKMDVFSWDTNPYGGGSGARSEGQVGQVALTMVSHNAGDYARLSVLTSDNKRFIVQVFNEDA